MDIPDTTRIRDDLRGTFRGRLALDPVSQRLYSTDASPFEIRPVGVAAPADEPDLQELVKYASEIGLPLIARGAGTGAAGGALGNGLVVDLSESFRNAIHVSGESVTVDVGFTHWELNQALAKLGRRFAPNPVGTAASTIGGMVSANTCGHNVFTHGYTREHVVGVRAVWDSGEVAELLSPRRKPGSATQAYPPKFGQSQSNSGPRTIELHAQTAGLIAANRELIHLTRPHTRFNRCGYILHDLLTPSGLDFPRLLSGSEGTLGLFTKVTLRTTPAPGGLCRAVLGFPNMDEGAQAGLAIRGTDRLTNCELYDARHVALARAAGSVPVPVGLGAALVLEVEGDSEREALNLLASALNGLRPGHRFAVLIEPTCTPSGLSQVERFCVDGRNGLSSLGPGPRPVPIVEDVAVPPEELSRFLAELRQLLQRSDVTAALRVQVPAGQIDILPFLDLNLTSDMERLWPLAEALYRLVWKLGGTISSRHGVGLARTPWVENQYGPLMPVFRELKRIFDPDGIFNPGKIIGPDPSRPAWPLRMSGLDNVKKPTTRTPLLIWRPGRMAEELESCNGCGDCRTQVTQQRMCPVFRVRNSEPASPRAKVGLLRELLEADPNAAPDLETVRAVADLCVNCKMCRSDCPAGVDIPKLMLEAKALDYTERGMERGDWGMARIEGLATFAGNFAFTTNRLLGNRIARWVLETVFGLSRKRLLPKFTHRTFMRRAKRFGLTQRPQSRTGKPRVAYFVDVFPNVNDPLIGEATVAVLERNGFEVYVPPRQRGCGMAALAHGDVDTARDAAMHNVGILADLVREGYTIICSEPSAALAITQDYLDLFDDPDTKLVANHTQELTGFLYQLHLENKLDTRFRPLDLTVGHHVPCHIKALQKFVAGPELLRLIPKLNVVTVDVGCSGMAGTWGLRADHFEASLQAGKPVFDVMRRPGVLLASTECGSCRMQIHQGVGKRTLHPVQYLALAYDLVPELERRLLRPLGELVSD